MRFLVGLVGLAVGVDVFLYICLAVLVCFGGVGVSI